MYFTAVLNIVQQYNPKKQPDTIMRQAEFFA